MSYKPFAPNQLGIFQLKNIAFEEITPFIDWRFFFLAWRISGRYDGIEAVDDCAACEAGWLLGFEPEKRAKAEEALKLFRDARALLREVLEDKSLKINACYSLFPAYSADDTTIIVRADAGEVALPMLRQQNPAADGFCYSLADFLATENDYLGAFVNTVVGAEELAKQYEAENDVYKSILIKTISDRLAEATAEWLHWKVRTTFWGYAADENLSADEMLKTQYKGIRPAIGYPSLPDQSLIFDLKPLLAFDAIGVSLTENGAMYPNASVCGIYLAHPRSKYFMVGKIDEQQLADYAAQRGKTAAETRKWLSANL